MKLFKTFSSACLYLLLILMVASCRKNQGSGWNTNLLVPIASTNLSLQNLVKDSSIVVNKDSSLTLAYQSSLYQFNLADQIVKIPDTSIGQKFNVDSLTLPNLRLNFSTSLGSLANQIGGIGTIIVGQNGQTTTVGPLNIGTAFTYTFDAGSLFDSATLVSGQAQIWAINGLPVAIAAGSTCTVSDSVSGHVLQTATFPRIPAFDSIPITLNLTPGRITSHFKMVIGNINTEASNGPVLIDTSNSIRLRVFVGFLHVSEAWAQFPNQNVVDQTNDVSFPLADRKFTYIEALSGKLRVSIANSVPQPLYLQYTLVGAYNKQGHPLNEYTQVPAAVNGHASVIDTTLDISGYSINLTGQNGSGFNTYTQRVITSLIATGQTQHITVADSLNVKYQLIDIKPNYVKGYMGRDTISTNDSAAFNFLSIFKSGSIDLQSVNMNFNVVNNIGVDGQIKINSLSAVSSNNGSRTLNSTLLGKALTVKRATDFPLTPAVSTFTLNNSNSNIKDLIGILPNKLFYDISVQTNVHGNNNQYRDFAYLQSGLAVNLDAEIPLSLIANHLILKDTIGFNLANTTLNINGVNDGIIYVITENKYPIWDVLSLVVYDSLGRAVDTLANNKLITAANTDANCRANQATQTVLQVYVDNARVNKLKQGQYAVITADFSTTSNNASCNGQHFKIYSDYTIGITLSAKFNYKLSTKL